MSSVFSMKDMATEVANKPRFIPLADNLYVLEVQDVKEETGPTYDGKGEQEQVIVTFKVKQPVDGSEMVDIEGQYPKNDLLKVWLNPAAISFNTRTNQPHKARQVLTAIMGVPVESPLEIKSWDDLVGKKVKAYVSVTTKPDGTKSNKLDKFSPYDGKKK